MTNETEIRRRVRTLVLETAPIGAAAGADPGAADLGADLGFDSLGREELAALLEDEFAGLTVPEEGFAPRTVAEVEAMVVHLLEVAI